MAKKVVSPWSKGTKFKFASGDHTSVTAADTITTGLNVVEGVTASMESDPVLTCAYASAVKSPTAGSVIIKTWMPTSSSVTTPVAATTFTKKVAWFAWGY